MTDIPAIGIPGIDELATGRAEEVIESDPAGSDPASFSDRPDRIFKETHSSGDSNDLLNTPEDRLRADPALEPELARLREDERLERAGLVRGVDGVAL